MNSFPNLQASSVFPVSGNGFDTGSPGGTFTAWTVASTLGVQIPNNGQVILWYVNGATAAVPYQVLIGDVIGNTGAVAPATQIAGTIAASSSGWLGPWSPATYNQQAPTLVTYAGATNTQALTAAAQGCVVVDFTVPTITFAVRAYTLIPVSP
ncbi:MAG TPA: hypothetical protein VGI66_00975 [Streptosporangiaceae bacterium]|jgi:hypothetical protein